jgi:predicted amidophosphoribosyltransferase
VGRPVASLLDLVLPVECAACGRPGVSWCRRCSLALARSRLGTNEPITPDPAPSGLPECFAWGRYTGPLRAGIRAWKDGGRRDLDRGLAQLLAVAIGAALRGPGWPPGPVLVVPAPSSARAERLRGDRPLARVTQHAVEGMSAALGEAAHPVGPLPVLRHRRDVADQAALGAVGRFANLHSAMEVQTRWAGLVRGRRCLLVDDVMTTGSTLAEGARALRDAGATDIRAAVIAATPRRPTPGWSSST